MVKAHYDLREDPGSIPEEISSWEGKPDHTQKGLVSFPDDRERG